MDLPDYEEKCYFCAVTSADWGRTLYTCDNCLVTVCSACSRDVDGWLYCDPDPFNASAGCASRQEAEKSCAN